MSYIDDLTYRTLIDGYGTSYPVRKAIKFVGASLLDDTLNDVTNVTVTATGGTNLVTTLTLGNNAGTYTIENLGNPIYDQDAATKNYVDTELAALTLNDVLTAGNATEGRNINLSGGSYIYSSDGNISLNDTVDLNTYKLINVGDPTLAQDAATKNYVDNQIDSLTLAEVLTNGNIATGSNINMTGNYIQELPTPLLSGDAANKAYVDGYQHDHGGLLGLLDDDHTQYLLANGTRYIDGNIAFSGDGYCLDNVGCIVFSLAKEPAEIPYEEGKLFYDTDNGSLSIFGKSPNTSLQIGQEIVLWCYNGTGATITNGQPVYIVGDFGNRPSIDLASAGSVDSSNVIGLATEDILPGQSGYVTITGLVHDVDTSAWVVGTRLYLSTSNGELTDTPPINGAFVMFVGLVSRQHQTQGIIAVGIKTPGSIQNMFDVYNGVPTSGNHLYGNGTHWVSQDFSTDVYESMGTLTNDPTGFPVSGGGNLSTISKVDATRTFTITPTGTSYNVYVLGNKFAKTVAESVVWSDVEGIHLFYFDANGTLTTGLAASINVGDIFVYNSIVSGIYWDATNKAAVSFAEERHGLQMDGYTHLYLHSTQGAKWSSGGALTSIIADGTGALNSHSQFGVDACIIWDEDIKLTSARTSQVLTNPAVIPIVYRTGATGLWRKKTADTFPLIQSGSTISGGTYTGANGLPAYNQWTGTTWQLTEVATGRFMCVHYYMTADVNTPIVGVLGQSTYINAPTAKEGAKTEINTLQGVIRLFAAEAAPLATVLYQCSTGYANTSKARIISPDVGITYIDLRGTVISGSGGVSTSTFADSVFRVYDNLDNTKTIALEASGITTGTTITLTSPNRDITLGNVLGPIGLSSTDNAIARWDGTTGQLIQNSAVTIDDSGNIITSGLVDGVDVSTLTNHHGGLVGLTDDDHTQYLLVNGTRAMTGNLVMDQHVINNCSSIGNGNNGLVFDYITGYVHTVVNSIPICTQYETYKQEFTTTPAITAYTSIPENGSVKYVYNGRSMALSRLRGTGTVVISSQNNWM